MGRAGRLVGDAALAALAVVVLVAVVMTLRGGDGEVAVASSTATTTATTTHLPVATATSTPPPSSSATPDTRTVVLVGPDLAALRPTLADRLGGEVQAVTAVTSLANVTAKPDVVVLQLLAGTQTSIRTTTALDAVKARWPQAHLDVVGPFSANDRKSAAAVQKAATGRATFLDPVTLHWRTADASATLTAADQAMVAQKLAAVLASV